MSRGLVDIMPNQILQDHLNPPVPWTVPVRNVLVTHLPVHDTVHGEAGIEPGLVAIAIDYGYMRAYDDLDPKPTVFNNNPSQALHDNTDAIIDLRLTIWQLECNINGQRLPLQDILATIEYKLNGTPIVNPIADSTQLPALRQMKWQLKSLVDQRRLLLGGRVPPGAESWWLNWEPHLWGPQLPVRLTPWMQYQSALGPDVPAEPPPLGDDNRLLAEKSSTGAAYIVFGGAKFFVPLPWKNFLLGNAFRVPDGSLQYDQSVPADGTVLREDAGNTVYVTFGGAKFAIPGLPWPGAVPGTSLGAINGVNIVPNGSLSSVGDILANGTLLIAVNAAGATGTAYVVWGGAKFPIPQSVLQDYELCADLGYLGRQIHQVPDTTLTQIPDIPRDGTVLREIHAADPFLIRFGTKKEVLGPRRFFDLGLFWPDVGILWDGALDALPDGGPA
jgi:hypothetical protein